MANAKSIVIYFSRADENYSVGTITEGNTAKVAKIIAAETRSDMWEIKPVKAYPKNYNECINVAQKEQREKANLEGKTIRLFVTHEGSGSGGLESSLKKTEPKAKITKSLAIRGTTAQNDKAATEKAVKGWL